VQVHVNFFGQPWQDGSNLDDFIHLAASQAEPGRFRIAVAWAKRSGLSRIQTKLDAWRAAGGQVEMLVGISEGGATRQGLELALNLADSVHLFHDVSGRTFHPKVYLARTGEAVNLYIGSNNMTAGGLYFNYEAGIGVRVPLADAPSTEIIDQVETWFDRLLSDADCCQELTAANLATLIAEPAFRIGDEDKRRKPAKNEDGAPEEIDAVAPTDDEEDEVPFFARSQSAKKKSRHDPPKGGASAASDANDHSPGTGPPPLPTPPAAAPPTPPAPQPAPEPAPTMRWSKRLKGTDAQQPPGTNTSRTHNLRLAAARHPIDIRTYWRKEYFDTTPWQVDATDPSIEYTTVEMSVSVYGESLGAMQFRVDHDLDRVSGQGNVPTVLKWGPLSSYMRIHNHVDDWVLLEKLDNGTLSLRIEATDPGTR
jgi:HKD family nuclease